MRERVRFLAKRFVLFFSLSLYLFLSNLIVLSPQRVTTSWQSVVSYRAIRSVTLFRSIFLRLFVRPVFPGLSNPEVD